jgi:hypothetical protein
VRIAVAVAIAANNGSLTNTNTNTSSRNNTPRLPIRHQPGIVIVIPVPVSWGHTMTRR